MSSAWATFPSAPETPDPNTYQSRSLFGGAVSIALLADVADVSDIRPVPDTQEVFLHNGTDASFIVEVLEHVADDGSHHPAIKHFSALAQDNGALNAEILALYGTLQPPAKPPATPVPLVLEGTQRIARSRSNEPDDVIISLALYRIPDKNADVLLSMNVPVKTVQRTLTPDVITALKLAFIRGAQSLKIEDFGLFA